LRVPEITRQLPTGALWLMCFGNCLSCNVNRVLLGHKLTLAQEQSVKQFSTLMTLAFGASSTGLVRRWDACLFRTRSPLPQPLLLANLG
jgi:hypothetical protein